MTVTEDKIIDSEYVVDLVRDLIPESLYSNWEELSDFGADQFRQIHWRSITLFLLFRSPGICDDPTRIRNGVHRIRNEVFRYVRRWVTCDFSKRKKKKKKPWIIPTLGFFIVPFYDLLYDSGFFN